MDTIIVFAAQYLFVAVPLMAGWIWLKSSNKTKLQMALTLILAALVAFLLAKAASMLYYNPRPFADGSVEPLFSHGSDNGFPSDHSWFTMAFAALIFIYKRRLAWLALVLTVIVGLARVLAHVHSLIDIIAGFAVGVIAVALAYLVANKLLLSSSPGGK